MIDVWNNAPSVFLDVRDHKAEGLEVSGQYLDSLLNVAHTLTGGV